MSDFADRASRLEQRHRDVALARARQQQVEQPQERNNKGQVICCRCGEVIPKARLAAQPRTPFCVDCKREVGG